MFTGVQLGNRQATKLLACFEIAFLYLILLKFMVLFINAFNMVANEYWHKF